MRLLLLFFLFTTRILAQPASSAIGTWRDHLPYGTVIDVTASPNKIYAATPYSLFSVDTNTEEMERFSKISGLSETGISTIQFDPLSQKLWIAYTNSNIDVITSNKIINIPDLKRENVNQDKTIYHFFPDNTVCYAATGLGIIVLNAEKYEIKDSWIIGNGGQYVKTYMVTKDGTYFYAATAEGLKRTAISNPNPADFRSWEILSGKNGLAVTACKGVVTIGDRVVALQNDSLFIQKGANWELFYNNGNPITSINATENRLVVSQDNTVLDQVVVLNSDGSTFRTIQQPALLRTPKKGLIKNNLIWIADSTSGLSRWDASGWEQFQPNAPTSIITGSLAWYNNVLYATAGGVTANWQPLQQLAGLYQYKEGNWVNYTRFTQPALTTITDLTSVVVDPRDESVWSGSFGSGLLHLKANNQIDVLRQAPLSGTIAEPQSIRISGLAFDNGQNLWVSNFGAASYLHVLKANNSWQSFTAPFGLNNNAVSQILIDDANQLWIVSPNGNGLLLFNHNNTIDNKADDKWRLLRSGPGNGNLPSNEVLTLAKDKSGYIWVGTNDGIGIIQCPQDVFSSLGCEAILPVAQQGNFANYLFKGEEVRTIAVDGADRKWIGTKNGVWLISAEGEKVIERFTEENSPLPSNDVKQITIDGNTGEVFIATARGMVSYKGSATETTGMQKELLIYPNPVPPTYGGTIAIKGLSFNSTVKITELNGRLVYQGRSLGGQAVWNGKDLKGNTIASGVYLVLVVDEQQQERAAGKIVFIAK